MQQTIRYKSGKRQRPCFAILPRTHYGKSDFRGWITLEDGRFYWVGISVVTDRLGLEYLRLHLQPELGKNPMGPYPERCVTLHRAPPNRPDWQSDFRGSVAFEGGRFYSVGASVCTDRSGGQYLRLYLRPEHTKRGFTLEVV
jgi:hypothetical protein